MEIVVKHVQVNVLWMNSCDYCKKYSCDFKNPVNKQELINNKKNYSEIFHFMFDWMMNPHCVIKSLNLSELCDNEKKRTQ